MDILKKRILIVTAVDAEKDAILRGVQHLKNIDISVVGVGPIIAAANTARILSRKEYGLVISAGIGGGFQSRAEVGTLAIADEIVSADLGTETLEGFSSFEELGLGFTQIKLDPSLVNQVRQILQAGKLSVATGPILTVSTATGTAASATERAKRVPGAVAEAMEGFGVAVAAQLYGIPALEIRSISNAVGPRDKKAWRIQEALDVLEKAFTIVGQELQRLNS